MNAFLRYLVYCFIILYSIRWTCHALSHMLEYISGSQETHESVVAHHRRPLTWIHLIRIKA